MSWYIHFTVLGLLVVGYLIHVLVFLRWRAASVRAGYADSTSYARWKFHQLTWVWAAIFFVYLTIGLSLDYSHQLDLAVEMDALEREKARVRYEQEVLTSLREIRRALGIEDLAESVGTE